MVGWYNVVFSGNEDGGGLNVRHLRLKDKVLTRLETLLQYLP